jgi:YidC/Oxa1 family membrane protein insertase
MESQRNFIIIALAIVSYLLFVEWQNDYAVEPQVTQKTVEQPNNQVPELNVSVDDQELAVDVPSGVSTNLPANAQVKSTPQVNLIEVNTDVLQVKIDPVGGDIVDAKLTNYPVDLENPDMPVTILTNSNGRIYTAMSGLVGQGMPETVKPRARYQVKQANYELTDDEDQLEVVLEWVNDAGVKVNKIFTFDRGSYAIDVDYQVINSSEQAINANFFGQLKRDQLPNPKKDTGGLGIQAYLGAAYSTTEQLYERYDFDDMADAKLNVSTQGGWVAYLQHYFISAWIPPQSQTNTITTLTPNGLGIIRILAPTETIAPGETKTLGGQLYIGPKIQDELEKIAPGLDLTVDYGFLWWIGQPLFWLLTWFEFLLGNWGLAIIMVTVTVKMLFYPLSNAQYRSFARMRAIQPKMTALKDRYGDDRQKMSQAMMELYKKEKVNPLGGCLPLIVQMPVFIALYWVLLESVELRHAEFYLWIDDLSAMDPYYILPLLMGSSMWLMQKMQPTAATMDPMQQKIMQFMPVIMTVFFLFFPAGLVLYWVVNNCLSIAQQVYVTKKIERETAEKAANKAISNKNKSGKKK